MRKRRMSHVSALACVDCGYVMFVPRMSGTLRAHGHVKTMWCPHCEKVTDHVEEVKW